MVSIPASPLPGAGFDATRWLSAWTAHGGIYVLAGERLYLRRSSRLDPFLRQELDRLCADMLRAGGGPSIAAFLHRQREGDLPL